MGLARFMGSEKCSVNLVCGGYAAPQDSKGGTSGQRKKACLNRFLRVLLYMPHNPRR